MTGILSSLREQAVAESPQILIPEHQDERVLAAAAEVASDGIARPVVLDSEDSFAQHCRGQGIDPTLFETVARDQDDWYEDYVQKYVELRGVTPEVAETLLESNLVLGMLMLRCNDVDGIVAGALHPTGEVVATANGIVGLDSTIKTASSFFLMITDNADIGEDGALVYADCGVNISPSSDQLADIAHATATTVERLLDWEPRVAMLSFSTKGSANHESVEKVREATSRVKDRTNDLLIDGELQSDAALVPSVADRKTDDDAAIQGDANVLVFPDLESGNIAYKLTERLGGAKALGPILQGYTRPLSDLSRGASTDAIYDIMLVTAARAARWDSNTTGEIISGGLLKGREKTQRPLHPPNPAD